MNERHEANRYLWEARSADWTKRGGENLWRRCHREHRLVSDERELQAVEEFGSGSDGDWEVPPVGGLPRVLLVVARKR